MASKSQYGGKFIKKNGRTNNSSEYNHIYYLRNKHKWQGREIDGTYYDNVRSYDGREGKGWEFYSETEEHEGRNSEMVTNSLAVVPVKNLFSSSSSLNYEYFTSGVIDIPGSHVFNIHHVFNEKVKRIGTDRKIFDAGKKLLNTILKKPAEKIKQSNAGFAIRR